VTCLIHEGRVYEGNDAHRKVDADGDIVLIARRAAIGGNLQEPLRVSAETSSQEPAPVLSRSTSIGIWIPTIWYGIAATRSVSRWLALAGYQVTRIDALDGSPLDRGVYLALMLFAIVILAARRVRWTSVVSSNRWLCTLFLYMLLSLVWSDYPGLSFKRWIRSLIDALMALVVLTSRNPLEAECAVIRRVMLISLPLSIVFIKYFRHIGVDWDELGTEMWVGVTTHKNVLGGLAMIGALYCLFEILRRRWQPKPLMLFGGYALLAAWILRGADAHRSNTAILGFIIGAFLLCSLHLMRSRVRYYHRYILAGVCVVGPLLIAAQMFQSPVMDQSVVAAGIAASGRDATLTGRTELWSDLWTIASNQPLVGVGYGAFWVGNTHGLWERHSWQPSQGHNGYLDVYLELGVLGVILFLALIIASIRSLLKRLVTNFEQAALHLTWLSVIVLHNITETSYLRGSVDLWFIFLLSTIAVPFRPAITSSSITPNEALYDGGGRSTAWGSQQGLREHRE
jgi:exopolysaccharide production protein ExoQ